MQADQSSQVFEREFPGLRARILEIAATLDRLERSGGPPKGDVRWEQVRRALAVLLDVAGDRAEAVQLIFSRPYEVNWWQELEMDALRHGRSQP